MTDTVSIIQTVKLLFRFMGVKYINHSSWLNSNDGGNNCTLHDLSYNHKNMFNWLSSQPAIKNNSQGSHKNLRKKFHDFSMTFPCPNQNFQTQNTNINCMNIRFCGSYINLLNQLQIYISILIVTPCLLPWIREFIHAQNCNTMLKTTATPFI